MAQCARCIYCKKQNALYSCDYCDEQWCQQCDVVYNETRFCMCTSCLGSVGCKRCIRTVKAYYTPCGHASFCNSPRDMYSRPVLCTICGETRCVVEGCPYNLKIHLNTEHRTEYPFGGFMPIPSRRGIAWVMKPSLFEVKQKQSFNK